MKPIELEEIEEGKIEPQMRWDIKKIGIGLFVLAVLGILGSMVLFPSREAASSRSTGTLGVTSEEETQTPELPTEQDVEKIISETKQTLSNITYDNLTSSEAAIQKVINDLNSLQGKKDAKAVVCDLVCKDN